MFFYINQVFFYILLKTTLLKSVISVCVVPFSTRPSHDKSSSTLPEYFFPSFNSITKSNDTLDFTFSFVIPSFESIVPLYVISVSSPDEYVPSSLFAKLIPIFPPFLDIWSVL